MPNGMSELGKEAAGRRLNLLAGPRPFSSSWLCSSSVAIRVALIAFTARGFGERFDLFRLGSTKQFLQPPRNLRPLFIHAFLSAMTARFYGCY
jgi:hypothetical protein